jgi:hypothetical protein
MENTDQNENNQNTENTNYVPTDSIYKIFVFESNTAKLLKTESYVDFPDVQKEILDYNKDNQNNRWNLFIGTEFPPKGVKFDDTIKQFIDKTLSEKVADGEIEIPPDFKIVNNVLVRLTKKELLEKGLLVISYDEKIDEFDQIVKLTKKEMYAEGKITKYQIYEYFIQELNLKIENKLKNYYNYPMQEMGTWSLKKEQAIKWISLDKDTKIDFLQNDSIISYNLIIAESKILDSDDIEQKIEKIDSLCNKIIIKYKDLEITYGNMFSLRSQIKKQLEEILNLNNVDVYQKMEEIFNNIES